MRRLITMTLGLLATPVLAQTSPAPAPQPAPTPTVSPAAVAALPRVKIDTTVGSFTVEGRSNRTPREDRYDIQSVEKVGDDYWGGGHHGNNLYSDSLVALDALTGKVKWFHQLVHHDIWDYDVAAPPALIDVVRNGQVIPAVAQQTSVVDSARQHAEIERARLLIASRETKVLEKLAASYRSEESRVAEQRTQRELDDLGARRARVAGKTEGGTP